MFDEAATDTAADEQMWVVFLVWERFQNFDGAIAERDTAWFVAAYLGLGSRGWYGPDPLFKIDLVASCADHRPGAGGSKYQKFQGAGGDTTPRRP